VVDSDPQQSLVAASRAGIDGYFVGRNHVGIAGGVSEYQTCGIEIDTVQTSQVVEANLPWLMVAQSRINLGGPVTQYAVSDPVVWYLRKLLFNTLDRSDDCLNAAEPRPETHIAHVGAYRKQRGKPAHSL